MSRKRFCQYITASTQGVIVSSKRPLQWLEQGRNPILLVRKSAKRQRTPEWRGPEELKALLLRLDRYFRVMAFLGAATGLRRSELLGLKWETLSSRASKPQLKGTLLAIGAHGSKSRR